MSVLKGGQMLLNSFVTPKLTKPTNNRASRQLKTNIMTFRAASSSQNNALNIADYVCFAALLQSISAEHTFYSDNNL